MTHKQRSSTRSGKAHGTASNGPALHQEHRLRTTASIRIPSAVEYPDISVSFAHADRVSRNFPLLKRRTTRACVLLHAAGGTANVRAAAALIRALDSVKVPLLMGKIIISPGSRQRRSARA